VQVSLKCPNPLPRSDGVAPCGFLDGDKRSRASRTKRRFYQASNFQNSMARHRKFPKPKPPLFIRGSPYAAAKLYAHWVVVKLPRGLQFARFPNGILFNHESEAAAKHSSPAKLRLPRQKLCSARQDALSWAISIPSATGGYAPEYGRGHVGACCRQTPLMIMCLHYETHTVREFIEETFRVAGDEICLAGEWCWKKLACSNQAAGKS